MGALIKFFKKSQNLEKDKSLSIAPQSWKSSSMQQTQAQLRLQTISLNKWNNMSSYFQNQKHQRKRSQEQSDYIQEFLKQLGNRSLYIRDNYEENFRCESQGNKELKERQVYYCLSEYENQLKTLNKELTQINHNVKENCNTNTIEDYIKEKIMLLQLRYKFHYDDIYKNFKKNSNGSHIYILLRQTKIKFRCFNEKCQLFQKSSSMHTSRLEQPYKKWTSYRGLVKFQFYLEFPNQKRIENSILRTNFCIYQQRCSKCKHEAIGQTYSIDRPILARIFAIVIEKILHQQKKYYPREVPLKYYEQHGYRSKDYNQDDCLQKLDNHSCHPSVPHHSTLCQACSQRVCKKAIIKHRYYTDQ